VHPDGQIEKVHCTCEALCTLDVRRTFEGRAQVAVWFLLDTGLSWYYDVTFNVVVALAAGLPLVFTRKAFV